MARKELITGLIIYSVWIVGLTNSLDSGDEGIGLTVNHGSDGFTHLDLSNLESQNSLGTISLKLMDNSNSHGHMSGNVNEKLLNIFQSNSEPTSTKIIRKTMVKSSKHSPGNEVYRFPNRGGYLNRRFNVLNSRSIARTRTSNIRNNNGMAQRTTSQSQQVPRLSRTLIQNSRTSSNVPQRGSNMFLNNKFRTLTNIRKNQMSSKKVTTNRNDFYTPIYGAVKSITSNKTIKYSQNQQKHNLPSTAHSVQPSQHITNSNNQYRTINRFTQNWIKITVHNMYLLRNPNVKIVKVGENIYVKAKTPAEKAQPTNQSNRVPIQPKSMPTPTINRMIPPKQNTIISRNVNNPNNMPKLDPVKNVLNTPLHRTEPPKTYTKKVFTNTNRNTSVHIIQKPQLTTQLWKTPVKPATNPVKSFFIRTPSGKLIRVKTTSKTTHKASKPNETTKTSSSNIRNNVVPAVNVVTSPANRITSRTLPEKSITANEPARKTSVSKTNIQTTKTIVPQLNHSIQKTIINTKSNFQTSNNNNLNVPTNSVSPKNPNFDRFTSKRNSIQPNNRTQPNSSTVMNVKMTNTTTFNHQLPTVSRTATNVKKITTNMSHQTTQTNQIPDNMMRNNVNQKTVEKINSSPRLKKTSSTVTSAQNVHTATNNQITSVKLPASTSNTNRVVTNIITKTNKSTPSTTVSNVPTASHNVLNTPVDKTAPSNKILTNLNIESVKLNNTSALPAEPSQTNTNPVSTITFNPAKNLSNQVIIKLVPKDPTVNSNTPNTLPDPTTTLKVSPELPVQNALTNNAVLTNNIPVKTAVTNNVRVDPVATFNFPVDPVVTRTVPVDPVVTRTVPVDPVVTRTVPVDPVVTRTVPVDPVVTRNVSVDPVVTRKVPVDPVVTRNVPVNPVVTRNVPVDPVVTRNVPVDPVVTRNVPVDPVVSRNVPVDPVVTRNVPVDPVVTRNVPVDPVVTRNVSVDPVVTRNVPVDPVVTRNVPVDPVMTYNFPVDPAVTINVTSNPVVTSNAPSNVPVVKNNVTVNPVLTNNVPVNPAVINNIHMITNNVPVDPVVTQNIPVDHVVTNNVPVDPIMTNNVPVVKINVPGDPVVTNNVPVDPVVTTNATINIPVVKNTIPVDPIVTNNVLVDPAVTNTVPVNHVVTNNVQVDPVVTNNAAVDPVVTNNVPVNPVVTNNATVDPVVTNNIQVDPVVTNNAAVDPVVTNNVQVKPAVTYNFPVDPVTNNVPFNPAVTNNAPVDPAVTKNVPVVVTNNVTVNSSPTNNVPVDPVVTKNAPVDPVVTNNFPVQVDPGLNNKVLIDPVVNNTVQIDTVVINNVPVKPVPATNNVPVQSVVTNNVPVNPVARKNVPVLLIQPNNVSVKAVVPVEPSMANNVLIASVDPVLPLEIKNKTSVSFTDPGGPGEPIIHKDPLTTTVTETFPKQPNVVIHTGQLQPGGATGNAFVLQTAEVPFIQRQKDQLLALNTVADIVNNTTVNGSMSPPENQQSSVAVQPNVNQPPIATYPISSGPLEAPSKVQQQSVSPSLTTFSNLQPDHASKISLVSNTSEVVFKPDSTSRHISATNTTYINKFTTVTSSPLADVFSVGQGTVFNPAALTVKASHSSVSNNQVTTSQSNHSTLLLHQHHNSSVPTVITNNNVEKSTLNVSNHDTSRFVDVLAHTPVNSSTNTNSINSNILDSLLKQGHQLDYILKHTRNVPVWHSYALSNGSVLTWITIDANSSTSQQVLDQTSNSRTSISTAANHGQFPTVIDPANPTDVFYHPTNAQPVAKAIGKSQASAAQGGEQTVFNETGFLIDPELVDLEPKADSKVINTSDSTAINDRTASNNASTSQTVETRPNEENIPTEAGEVLVSEVGIVADQGPLLSSPLMDSPTPVTEMTSSKSGLEPIKVHDYSTAINHNTVTDKTPELKTNSSQKNEGDGVINSLKNLIQRHPSITQIKQKYTSAEITNLSKVNPIRLLFTTPDPISSTTLPSISTTVILATSTVVTTDPTIHNIPTSNKRLNKDPVGRHTQTAISYDEPSLTLTLGEADHGVSIPTTIQPPTSQSFDSKDLSELRSILESNGIQTAEELNQLLKKKSESESRQKLNSIAEHFTKTDNKCPNDKPCLWCRSSPAWSYVDGMSGWCMRNCKTQSCVHSRCKCKCVNADEFSTLLQTIASSDLRGK